MYASSSSHKISRYWKPWLLKPWSSFASLPAKMATLATRVSASFRLFLTRKCLVVLNHSIHRSSLRSVIPGTKCQVYHTCSGGEPTNINQCGDGLWYDPKSDYCEAQIQGVPIDCPPDPACPSQSTPTTGSPEFASLTEFQGETTGKIVLNSLTFLFW